MFILKICILQSLRENKPQRTGDIRNLFLISFDLQSEFLCVFLKNWAFFYEETQAA